MVSKRWPGEAMGDLEPDAHAASVALSHDPRSDEPDLRADRPAARWPFPRGIAAAILAQVIQERSRRFS